MNVKAGRNDPCPCGSGKKYKKCCAGKYQSSPAGLHTLLPGLMPASVNHPAPRSNDAVEHYNSGNSMIAAGQFESAIASYRRALKIKPDFVEAHFNLANALRDNKQLEEAVASYGRVLAIRPDFADAHYNLGIVLDKLGQLDDAVQSFRRVLGINPDDHEALNNLANTLQVLGQIEDAVTCYRRALAIKPDFFDAHSNLIFALNYNARHTHSYRLEEAQRFGRLAAQKAFNRFSEWHITALPDRLRVGIVSGDLRYHSVIFFLLSVLANIDPARIELIAYPTHPRKDELTARIRPCFSAWKSLVNKSDEEAARLIHADGINILLDLSGHSSHNRLPVFSWKPAPVQVTWLGYPSTTGVAEMDFILGDPYAIPPEDDHHFSEAVWRMPESYVCLAVPSSPVEVAPLPALAAGYVTFGSFNNLSKMNDTVVEVWSRILKAVPESRLLLKTKQLKNSVVCEKTRQHFLSCGIPPGRLILSGTLPAAVEHLATYHKVDIALDTFPYPGVTTSAEALWMGVPVLSMRGYRFLSRTAESIAHNAGLPDWVAADENDYAAKAIAFASNHERLAALRAGLRQQVLASPLFNAKRFAQNFEIALWGMWEARGK